MTLSSTPSTKLGIFGAAILYTLFGFATLAAPVSAEAKASGPFYKAELAQPAAERIVIAGGVAFTCEGTTCSAAKSSSRPMRVCRDLQRGTGEIVAFVTEGEQLDADKLAKCNG